MASVVVEMSGDEARLWRAQQKIIQQAQKIESGYSKATREAKQLEKAGVRIYESTRTPAEQHERRMVELHKIYRAGKIDAETLGRAIQQSAQAMRQADGSAAAATQEHKRLAAAQRQQAEIQRQLGAEGRRVWEQTRTPMERHERKMEELRRLYRGGAIDQETLRRAIGRSVDQMKQADTTGRRAFGAGAAEEVMGFATSFLSVGAAVGVVTTALREMRQVSKEATAGLRANAPGLGSLGQLAQTPADLDRLFGDVKQTVKEGGAATEGDAARLIFTLNSLGMGGDRELFSQIAASKLETNPTGLATSVKRLVSSMGADETGDTRQIISKALAAATRGSGTVSEILDAAAGAGASAGALQITDEENLAAIATLSNRATAAQASTQLRALMRAAQRQGMSPASLADLMQNIQARGMSDPQLIKFFGSDEALEGYRGLSQNRQLYQTTLGEVRAAQDENLVDQRIRMLKDNPRMRAALLADRGEGGLRQIREEKYGTAGAIADSMIAQRLAELEQRGYSRSAIWLEQTVAEGRRALFGDTNFALYSPQGIGRGGPVTDYSADLVRAIEDLRASVDRGNELQAETAANTAEAAGRVRPGGQERATGLSE